MPLKFRFQDYRGTVTYMELDAGMVNPGERHSLDNTIEIESDLAIIDAYMKFFSGESEIHDMMGIQVDNSENFAPTSGPDFSLNPKSRTHAEVEPKSIINQVADAKVPSTWNGFGLHSEGWVEDYKGQRCLRIPAGRTLDIEYEAFSEFMGSNNTSSLTIELDLASKNNSPIIKADGKFEDDPILRMCSYLAGDGKPLGFELKPTAGAFLTQNCREYGDQDIAFQEGVRTHITVNILYHIYGTTQNYIRIFVNGIINREFSYEPSDTFAQYVGRSRTSQGIRLGSATCDLDLYGIRIYKKALSAANIRQDYMASLPTSEEKKSFREANDILGDDGRINYSKSAEKYITIVG